MGKVHFENADLNFNLIHIRKVKLFLNNLFTQEGYQLNQVTYIFCSDNFLLDINKRFLKHDYFTDIITFDLSESNTVKSGEIYISIDRVKENAQTHGQAFNNELMRVIIHGALHICGYKDKKKSEITIMRQKEDQFLRLFEDEN